MYSVFEYVPGVPIVSYSWHLMSKEERHKLLDGIATFLLDLWTCPAPLVQQGEKV
jgi:hypothetical protein